MVSHAQENPGVVKATANKPLHLAASREAAADAFEALRGG